MELEEGIVDELRADRGVLRAKHKRDRVTFFFDRRRALEGVTAPSVFLNERRPVCGGDVKIGSTVHFLRRGTDPSCAARWETQDGFEEAQSRIKARLAKASQLPLPIPDSPFSRASPRPRP